MATKKVLLDWSETGSTVYTIVERDADGALLNDADGSFTTVSTVADPYWSLTEHSIIKGRYSATRSDATWSTGLHTYAIYSQAGTAAVPVSDTIIGTGLIFIVGDAEVVLDKSVASLNDLSSSELASQLSSLNDLSSAELAAQLAGLNDLSSAELAGQLIALSSLISDDVAIQLSSLNDLSSAELATQLAGLNDISTVDLNNSNSTILTAIAGLNNLSTADLAATPMTVSTAQLPPQIKKNTALAGFTFYMVSTVDNISGATGLTVTEEVSIDGGAFGALTNAFSEIGSGVYKIDLDAADLNGDTITLKFTAPGANAEVISIITQS